MHRFFSGMGSDIDCRASDNEENLTFDSVNAVYIPI
jgi:hypothetical protein